MRIFHVFLWKPFLFDNKILSNDFELVLIPKIRTFQIVFIFYVSLLSHDSESFELTLYLIMKRFKMQLDYAFLYISRKFLSTKMHMVQRERERDTKRSNYNVFYKNFPIMFYFLIAF